MLDQSIAGSPALQAGPRGPATTSWSSNGSAFLAALLLVAALIVAPLWLVDYPGMVDYPNHLVRCYILAHIHADAVFAQRYTVVADPIPNLAIEAIVVPLNHVLPIMVSGKIFLTLMALLYIAGCLLLGHAITGKRSWIALAVCFTFYNSALFYGFVNYMFGVSLFLCIFAFWLRSRARMPWPNFAALCLLSLLAFLVHLSCIVFLTVACVTVAILEFARSRQLLLLVRQLAWLACPAILMLGFMKGSGQVGTIEWSTVPQKFVHLFTPVRSYNLALDGVVYLLGVVTLVLLLRTGHLNRTAAAGVVLFLLFLVTPHVLFTSSAADVRYVMPALLVFVLAISPSWGRRESVAFALLCLALIARTAEVGYSWRIINDHEARLLHLGDNFPEDARVLVANKPTEEISAKFDRGFLHVVNVWTVTHHASVSSLFTNTGQQPLVLQSARCEDASRACIRQYDYVLVLRPDMALDAALEASADLSGRTQSASLWKVRHAAP